MLSWFFITLVIHLISSVSGQRGPVCYSCQSINDISSCTTVDRCDPKQVCSIETDFQNSGKLILGCKDKENCSNYWTDFTCNSCCQGDLCNSKGCDIKEIPKQQGPICYTCRDHYTATECSEITQCAPDEVCMLARVLSGNNVMFNGYCVSKYVSSFVLQNCLGCCKIPSKVCPSDEMIALGKRELETYKGSRDDTIECIKCCTGNLCNDIDCYTVGSTNKPAISETSSTTQKQSDPTTVLLATRPQPIDGLFGKWSSWTPCPYSCGKDGIQHRFRHCDSPPPQNGGNICVGSQIDRKICHNALCCIGSPTITYIDQDTFAHAGDFVAIHCNATNADNILWEGPKIIGHQFPDNVEVIQGLNLLVISKIAHNNTGIYRCVAQNSCGITSKYVKVDLIK